MLLAMADADHPDTGWVRSCSTTTSIIPRTSRGEIAAIDQFSGGRVELGLGAGHAFPEYASIGMQFDPPAVRKARLAEAVEILRRLLDGETVTWSGEHYDLDAVRSMPGRARNASRFSSA